MISGHNTAAVPNMISISQFRKNVKDDFIQIFCDEDVFCPVCLGNLNKHGWCHRDLKEEDGVVHYYLPVLYCKRCNRSHRALPNFMIPYKRYYADAFAEIYDHPNEPYSLNNGVDETHFRHMRAWVCAFVAFAKRFLTGLKIQHPELTADYDTGSTLSALKYFVRIVVNSNEWRFSVPPLPPPGFVL